MWLVINVVDCSHAVDNRPDCTAHMVLCQMLCNEKLTRILGGDYSASGGCHRFFCSVSIRAWRAAAVNCIRVLLPNNNAIKFAVIMQSS